jgi:hypothetical protein
VVVGEKVNGDIDSRYLGREAFNARGCRMDPLQQCAKRKAGAFRNGISPSRTNRRVFTAKKALTSLGK